MTLGKQAGLEERDWQAALAIASAVAASWGLQCSHREHINANFTKLRTQWLPQPEPLAVL